MDSHPIPQNVTSFQFKLVGDMTLKQFIYLAIGSVIAYILFVALAPIYPLVAWPLIILSASLGVAFAFLPIASRPLDYWLKAFLRAIYSPTKRVWKKNNKSFKDDALFNSRLVTYLSSMQPQVAVLTQPQTVQRPAPTAQPATQPVAPAAPAPMLSKENLGKTVDLARQAQNIQIRILQTERMLNQIKSEASQPSAIPVDYSGQVNQIMTDLQGLIAQASQVKQQINTVTQAPASAPQAPAAPVASLKESVKVVTPTVSKQTQLALTTFPNVINGIIKDKTGNYIEGCIAVIHDKEGLPVRALKTNKLGQFTGSTPLPNGIYKLTLEKDAFVFDVLQIELKGEVLPPLLITAK
jgi:hypothetical protein